MAESPLSEVQREAIRIQWGRVPVAGDATWASNAAAAVRVLIADSAYWRARAERLTAALDEISAEARIALAPTLEEVTEGIARTEGEGMPDQEGESRQEAYDFLVEEINALRGVVEPSKLDAMAGRLETLWQHGAARAALGETP